MAITSATEHGRDDPQIVLVRHGETEWSRTGRHTGRTDIALTRTGEYKAELAGEILAGRSYGLVLSSPLGRARETARLAGFPDVECDDDLTEWDYGSYEGLTTPQIVAQLGRPWSVFQDGAPAGETPGESPDEVTARVKRVFDRVLPSLERGERVLLFSHGHFLRAMASTWLGLSASGGRLLALDTSAVSSLGFEHGAPVIVGWNRVPGR